MVRPTVSPIQARVLGAVLGVTGFAFASISGISASHVFADSHIPDGKIWVTADGSKDGPPAGDFVRKFDCGDVDVWGNELNDKSGHFDIVFDDHDGKDRTIVDGAEWDFGKSDGGKQVIYTIDGKDLISKMEDKGFHPQDNGWHMDLVFNDNRGTVEFILQDNCEEESNGGGGGGSTPVVQQQAPPPVVKGTTTAAPKAAAVVPETGADAPFLSGLMLMSAGSAALGFARRLKRRGR